MTCRCMVCVGIAGHKSIGIIDAINTSIIYSKCYQTSDVIPNNMIKFIY
ncbi:hypothetical protein [Candidatus Hodgkinia cicadicola]